jgi:hypothetical protein
VSEEARRRVRKARVCRESDRGDGEDSFGFRAKTRVRTPEFGRNPARVREAGPWSKFGVMGDERSYDTDDVRRILDRALTAQPQAGLSHDELLAIGAEVGLSRAAVEQAAEEVRDDAARRDVVARRRRGLLLHALIFLLVNAALFGVNFLTTPGEWWVLFPVFGWGLGLLLHAVFGLSHRVSPGRLNRARRRLERAQRGSTRQRLAEPTAPVRLAADEPEVSEEAAAESSARDATTRR